MTDPFPPFVPPYDPNATSHVVPVLPFVKDTLAEAKDALFLALSKGDGVQCPCCEQYARVWRRVLGSTIAGPLKDIFLKAEQQRAEYRVADAARVASPVTWSDRDLCRCTHMRGSHVDYGCKLCTCIAYHLARVELPPNAAIDVVIGYVDVRQFHYRGGDYAKGTIWGLLAPHPSRPNIFHLTELGVAFVEGKATVPRYALIYNDGLIGFSDERTDINTALGTSFSVDEMKAGQR